MADANSTNVCPLCSGTGRFSFQGAKTKNHGYARVFRDNRPRSKDHPWYVQYYYRHSKRLTQSCGPGEQGEQLAHTIKNLFLAGDPEFYKFLRLAKERTGSLRPLPKIELNGVHHGFSGPLNRWEIYCRNPKCGKPFVPKGEEKYHSLECHRDAIREYDRLRSKRAYAKKTDEDFRLDQEKRFADKHRQAMNELYRQEES